ncbi:hypothetical protein [Brevibacterium casei]
MTDRQTRLRQGMARLRAGAMPGLAGACVLALIAAIVAMAIVPTGSTLARFYSEAGDDTETTLTAQGIEAGTDGVVTPDYGSWNWFDRQMNETSLTLKNTSPTTMVASIRIASVELAGTNISEAWGKAAAFIVDDGGVKREISNYVTADTSTKQFSETELRWTLAPGAEQSVPVLVEGRNSRLLYQDLARAFGVRFDFRFAVDWSIEGLPDTESAQLYPYGALGPEPGDRPACPPGASAAQECVGVSASVKKPAITVDTGQDGSGACYGVFNVDNSHTFVVNTSELPEFAGMAKTARRLAGDPAAFDSYVAIPEVGSDFTGNDVEVSKQSLNYLFGYDVTVRFVIRGTGGAGGHDPGPNGDRPTQSPIYDLQMTQEAFSTDVSCTVSRVTL